MEVFVARQPIFDRYRRVYGYELLFRSSLENFFPDIDGDRASSSVINNSFLVMGIQSITGGTRAFVNVTDSLLIDGTAEILPKDLTVVEILEGSRLDSEVIAACRRLHQAGYLLALDDFVYHNGHDPLLEIADILKIDYREIGPADRKAVVDRFAPRGIRLLAEKVETNEEYREALALGYDYFQGYFFTRPEVVVGKEVPGVKLNYLRMLQEIHRPNLNLNQLEEIIKREVSVSYKLLRYLNSAAFSFRQKITSIPHGLMLLGERNIRKWATVVALAGMANDKPEELVVTAILRARFCELLAPKVGLADRESELFLTGMLSVIDAILDKPMADILAELPISEEISTALFPGDNAFARVLHLVVAYEQAEWERVREQAASLSVAEGELPAMHLQALEWAQQVFRGLG